MLNPSLAWFYLPQMVSEISTVFALPGTEVVPYAHDTLLLNTFNASEFRTQTPWDKLPTLPGIICRYGQPRMDDIKPMIVWGYHHF